MRFLFRLLLASAFWGLLEGVVGCTLSSQTGTDEGAAAGGGEPSIAQPTVAAPGSDPSPRGEVSDAGGETAHNWALAPFTSGDAQAASLQEAESLGAATDTPDVAVGPATCPILCDCIIDVCGNVLRMFHHEECVPTCQGLSSAQLSCRMSHCRMGGTGSDKECGYAIGSGTDVPVACQ
jgi:hypothetical protein